MSKRRRPGQKAPPAKPELPKDAQSAASPAPLKPRKTLFVILAAATAVWIALLLWIYFAWVR